MKHIGQGKKTGSINLDELVFKKIYLGGEKMENKKETKTEKEEFEIDEVLQAEIETDAIWDNEIEPFYRSELGIEKKEPQKQLHKKTKDEEEIIEEVIQQLKEEQKKLNEEEKQRHTSNSDKDNTKEIKDESHT